MQSESAWEGQTKSNKNTHKTQNLINLRRILSISIPLFCYCLLMLTEKLTPLWLVPLLLWAGASFIFPFRFALPLIAMGPLASLILNHSNKYKIALNGMPITALDIYITLQNPDVLWQILTIPKWIGWAMLSATCLALVFATIILIKSLRPINARSFAAILVTLFMTGFAGDAFATRLQEFIKSGLSKDESKIWMEEGVAAISKKMGPIPFLIYSWRLESQSGTIFFRAGLSEKMTPETQLTNAYINHFENKATLKPNIVMIQLESIFDPDLTFELDRKTGSPLFKANQHTKLLAPMRVNIVGGGSWVTEFEALTGLDTRLFGYTGYYTHVAIGPYINAAFPAFMKQNGYATSAFFPTSGIFYNSRNAYLRYGFSDFFDWKDLNLASDWLTSDTELAEAFIKKTTAFDIKQPFFSYIVTNGAHSPYVCHSFDGTASYSAFFKAAVDPEMNCELNEYLLLLKKSEKAVDLVLDRLNSIEQETGRPFVLLIYGDHQPHSFTHTWEWVKKDYSSVRTAAPKNQTFVHVMASAPTILKGFTDTLPATLIPTLLSSFISQNAQNTYMIDNINLYEKCGPNPFPGLKSAGMFGVDKLPDRNAHTPDDVPINVSASKADTCQKAQDNAIAAWRGQGIVSKKLK